MAQMRILQDGTKVLLLLDGRLIAEIPWKHADEVARAIIIAARKAEEWDKALDIAKDNAVLLRAGVPLGLSNHPDILGESVKIARDDRELRLAMPGGIKAQSVVGTPTLTQSAPKPQFIRPGGVESAEKFGILGGCSK